MNEPPQHVHIDLDLELGSDPIRGRLGRGGFGSREFQGWIELAAALEAARTTDPIVAPPLPAQAPAG